MSEEIKHMFKSMGEKIVRLAPYVTLLSGLVVWDYLHSIGRETYFLRFFLLMQDSFPFSFQQQYLHWEYQ